MADSPTPLEAPVFARRHHVSSYDVGPDHRLTAPGLLRLLHETAQAHATAYAFGYRDLAAARKAWALVCIDLALPAVMPLGETDFTVETAVRRSRGPVVFRDYRASAGGVVFARGQSMWTVIDLDTRRATLPSPALRAKLDELATDDLAAVDTNRHRTGDPLPTHDRRTVHHHDCDFNGHLNNVGAAQWLLDAAYETSAVDASPSSRSLARLHVSYHTEALSAERLTVGTSPIGDPTSGRTAVELRGEDGRPVASGEVTLGPALTTGE